MDHAEKPNTAARVLFGGSCACGRITYESTAFPNGCPTCHCSICQKLGGGAFQSFVGVVAKQVNFYDRKEHLRYEGLPKDSIGGITFLRLLKGAERACCVDCRSPLAMRYMIEYDVSYLTLGTVDEQSVSDEKVKEALKPNRHLFGSQNPWWFNIHSDGLPIHDRFPGDYEEKWNAWVEKHGRDDSRTRAMS